MMSPGSSSSINLANPAPGTLRQIDAQARRSIDPARGCIPQIGADGRFLGSTGCPVAGASGKARRRARDQDGTFDHCYPPTRTGASIPNVPLEISSPFLTNGLKLSWPKMDSGVVPT